MAKVAIKSEKLTPFGGIFSIMEQFDSMLSPIIDQTLGQRCRSIIGYQYSEIIRSLMSVYFCGGSCVEDVTSHLMRHLSYHPTLRTCSSDTILRAIKELTQENISYTSDKGKTYDFNTADKLNALLIKALVSTGELNEVETYDVDFDHQFLETEKYDAKPTYKKFLGYRPGVYVIGESVIREIRVQKIIIRVQNNLFVFKIQNSKFKTRITVRPDVPRPFGPVVPTDILPVFCSRSC